MTAPHVLPLGVHEAAILREQRASERRVIVEALPPADMVREWKPSDLFFVVIGLRNRLLEKGYRTRTIVDAKGARLEVRLPR